MNRFGVENTPAQISCATSLSNLSIEDDAAVIRLPTEFHGLIGNAVPADEAMRLSSDDDDDGDSVADDDDGDDGDLLAACINIGMKKTMQANTAWRSGASIEPGSRANADAAAMDDGRLSPLSIDSDNDGTSNVSLLQQVIASGSHTHKPVEPLVETRLIDSLVSSSTDSLASNDDDPGSSSLLEQCIQSGMHKRPASSASTVITLAPTTNQTNNASIAANDCPDDEDDSELSDDNDGVAGDLLAACINMGMKKTQQTAGNVLGSPARLLLVEPPVAITKIDFDGGASDISTDDAEDVLRLQQCIRLGMTRRADGESAPSPLIVEQLPQKWPTNAHRPAAVVDYANGKHSDTSSSDADEHVPIDSSILAQCIQMGMHKRPTPLPLPTMGVARPRVPGGSSTAAPTTARSRSQPAPSQPFKSVAQIERDRHMERERQRERERQMERDRERRDQELLQQFQGGVSGKPYGTNMLPQLYQQQQQQHQHHHHQQFPHDAAAAPLTEYGCGCSTSGRYRCATHGGIVGGGSMRRRRDDPLPPIPVECSGSVDAARRQRRVKTRSKRLRPAQPPQQQQQMASDQKWT